MDENIRMDEDLCEYRLDNAALIFPPHHHRQQTTMYRVSADIDQPVRVQLLQEALDAMLDRCPYFRVNLRPGVFWYYLERCDTPPRVEAESRYPCMYIPYKKKGVFPFRVLAYRNRIAFEVAHFLTDGHGAVQFLNGLILEYLRRRGETIDPEGRVLECGQAMDPEEVEDSFVRYYQRGAPRAHHNTKAIQLKGRREKPPVFHIYQGTVDSRALKEQAAKYGVTIGEFLTGLLIYVIQEEMKARGRRLQPVRVAIPMNLRRIFPSKTMRNFALTIEPGIDPRLGEFSLDDVIQKVHLFMKMEFDPRHLRQQLARNVEGQTKLILRIMPRFVKDPVMRWLYNFFGRNAFTTSFSNLGRLQLPPQMQPFVKDYQFYPPPHKRSSFITSLAYNGRTHLIFGSTLKETSLEARFYRSLRQMGLSVSIKTNRMNDDELFRR